MRLRLVGAAALASAGALLFGVPASASTQQAGVQPRGPQICLDIPNDDKNCLAQAIFYPYGDRLVLHDREADGNAVYAVYEREDNDWRDGIFYNRNGASGNAVTADMNIKENTAIHFKVCLDEWGNDSCSNFQDATA